MSAAFEPDGDDWAKEDCACGHRRYAHKSGTGQCSRTVKRPARPADLPKPIYAADQEDDPFSWPTNWPAHQTWPIVERPCSCASFDYPEPPEPDWDDR